MRKGEEEEVGQVRWGSIFVLGQWDGRKERKVGCFGRPGRGNGRKSVW